MRTLKSLNPALLLSAGIAITVAACASEVAPAGSGNAPELVPLSDQVAYTDTEFVLDLAANDVNGDVLEFDFEANVPDIHNRADLRAAGDRAVFRWTPIIADVGTRTFDFTVSDGFHVDRETIAIEVRAGGGTAPVFREPAGSGMMMDPNQESCVRLEVVVDDGDSASVAIGQADPVIEGSILKQTSELTASWRWCPSPQQLQESDRYVLALEADDGLSPVAKKKYLVVLRTSDKADGSGGTGGTGGTAGTGGSANPGDTVPAGWTCDAQWYDENDPTACDCGCGAPDPDCASAGCHTPGCTVTGCNFCWDTSGNEITCGDDGAGGSGGASTGGSGGAYTGGSGGTGGGAAGSDWTCPIEYYEEGNTAACDCGCGAPDPDCGYGGCTTPDCTAPACSYCWTQYGEASACSAEAGMGGSGGASSLCDDTCVFANDGECDDGGPNALPYAACEFGTDCADCGPRW